MSVVAKNQAVWAKDTSEGHARERAGVVKSVSRKNGTAKVEFMTPNRALYVEEFPVGALRARYIPEY